MRPRSLALAATLTSALVAATGCGSSPPPAAPPPPRPVALAPAAAPAPPGHLVRAEVDRVLVTQGPPWVLRRVQMEEVLRADGKFTGWRMVGLPEEWKDIDLRPGDVVTRVNGLTIETPDEAWEAWKSVAKAVELRITLTRDGGQRQLVLPIDGQPSVETAAALGRDPGPSRPAPDARPAPSRGAVIESADEAY